MCLQITSPSDILKVTIGYYSKICLKKSFFLKKIVLF